LIDDEYLNNGERFIALTPIVQALLLTSLALAFRRGFWPADNSARISRALVSSSAIVCILLFLLVVSVGRYSLFYILYATIPGASAIRAGYRCMIVANLFAVTAIALTFDRIFSLSFKEGRILLRFRRVAVLTALLSLGAVEQVNLAPATGLSRKFEREYFSAVPRAPSQCRSFYIAPEPNHMDAEVQLDAMMIALAQQIPTINGYSGFLPPGWDFYDTKAADYERQALGWAVKRGIADGLCRIDVRSGTWTAIAVDHN
jgi:hypothetical protein